ncbi:MAG TPA: 50S ribosomal protein L18 [Longimicrobiales bacterium]|nr:50S ribosomal protein L18 [Longimicrobiales bacterium]
MAGSQRSISERARRLARRHRRVRKRVSGTADRPRLVVHRSHKNIQGQLVDDITGRVIVGVSTLAPELKEKRSDDDIDKSALGREAGKLLAERAREAGVESVVFDRGGYLYHGRVAAFAEGAREGGLKF